MAFPDKTPRRHPVLRGAACLAAAGVFVFGVMVSPSADSEPIVPETRVHAGNLVNDFKTNETASNARWRGRMLAVDGIVGFVDPDAERPYAVLSADGGPKGIRCVMDREHAADAARLAKGTPAFVAGKVAGLSADGVTLSACRVLNRKDAAKIPALAADAHFKDFPKLYDNLADFVRECEAAEGGMAGRAVSGTGAVLQAEERDGVCHAVLEGGVHCAMRDKVKCEPGPYAILSGTVESCGGGTARLRDCIVMGEMLVPGR